MFTVGQEVVHTQSGSRGIVTIVHPLRRGRQYYSVFIGNETRVYPETALAPFYDSTDPFEKLRHGDYSSFDDFLLNNIEFKLTNVNDSNIPSLTSSRTKFKTYQFIPLLKILRSGNKRLLIADEVGLGKTIETGYIMLELKARKEMRTALVICPMSLREKWRDELKEKMGLRFKIYEKQKELVNDLRNGEPVMGIINYDKIKIPKDQEEDERTLLGQALQESGFKIDLLVCDEAHRLRNHTTNRHKAIRDIMEYAKAAVFLTATPIMTDKENLFYLLQLLDSNSYGERRIFNNMLAENEPFVKALSKLQQPGTTFSELKDFLEGQEIIITTEIGDRSWGRKVRIAEHYHDIPLYNSIIELLKGGEDTPETRAKLQYDITSLSKMSSIFSRTRKHDVITDGERPQRNAIPIGIKLNEDESRLYMEEMYNVDREAKEKGMDMITVTRERQLSSSLYAYLNNEEDLRMGKDRYGDKPDTKVNKLMEIIEEVVFKRKSKLIIFASFKKTIYYLANRLRKSGVRCVTMEGGTVDRDDVLRRFQYEGVQVLIATEVGGEGYDLQFADTIVNYDLPWNPMVIEQRIGRIDRFGQQSPVVHIYNFVVDDSVQERIYYRLLDRIGIFKSVIGDLDAILDSRMPSDTENARVRDRIRDLHNTNLTEEELRRRENEIVNALALERQNIQQMGERVDSTLINDIWFRNEIEYIKTHKQYITEKEILSLLRQLIRERLKTCSLEHVSENIYKINLTMDAHGDINNFLNGFADIDTDRTIQQFARSIEDKDKLLLTFNQDTAYEDKRLEFVNAFHPLVVVAMKFFSNADRNGKKNTFRYSIARSEVTGNLDRGLYCMALYEMKYKSKKPGQEQEVKLMVPILYNCDVHEIVEDLETAKILMGEAQEHAELMGIQANAINEEDVENMRFSFADAAEETYKALYEEEERRVESMKKLEIQRTTQFHDSIIENHKRILHELIEGTPLYNARQTLLSKAIEEKEKTIKKLEEIGMERELYNLVSLSMININ